MQTPVRIVLDTNVLVSGLLNRAGRPGLILNQILSGALTVVMDPRLMDEYQRVLMRPGLQIPSAEAKHILTYLSFQAIWVAPMRLAPEPDLVLDQADLPFAEAAVAGGVDALITGNPRHFTFLPAYGVRVLAPAEFLGWLDRREE